MYRWGMLFSTAGVGVLDDLRRGQDPSLRCHDNERFVGSGLDRSVPVCVSGCPRVVGAPRLQHNGATSRSTALYSVPKNPVRQSASVTAALSFSISARSRRTSSSTAPP